MLREQVDGTNTWYIKMFCDKQTERAITTGFVDNLMDMIESEARPQHNHIL